MVRLRRAEGHDWPDDVLDWAGVQAEVRRRDKAYADSLMPHRERAIAWVAKQIERVFTRRSGCR